MTEAMTSVEPGPGLDLHRSKLYALHRRARHSDSCWVCDVRWPCAVVAALIDADHEWALWFEKWCAAIDLVGSLGEQLSAAEAGLRSIAVSTCCEGCNEAKRVAQAALRAAEGKS